MKMIISFLTILFCLAFSMNLYAQERDQDLPQIESDWFDYNESPYTRGDRTFNITLGVLFPTFFSGIDNNRHGLSLGGTGTLTFNYFLSPNVFFGGELSGSFSGTRAGNMLYLIPFGARIGYQFHYRFFEFPVSIMIGAAPQRYMENGYFGPIIKPGASGFWRYNMDWSFGLNANWWILPQWPRNGNNVVGNFLELTLSARYHF